MAISNRTDQRRKRHRRVRKRVVGSAARPRLTVFRSNRHTYAQLVDDFAGATLVAASTLTTNGGGDPKERAKAVGKALADAAAKAGITRVTFDRSGFRYHGRVRAVADGAREGGLEF